MDKFSVKEKTKWFLPVGLYNDQMDSLEALHKHLIDFGMQENNIHVHNLFCLLCYFKDEQNEAYQDMRLRDSL